MRFFSELKGFAAWAEKELGKLSTEAPAIAKTTDAILTYVGGAASIIAGIEGGPAASAAVRAATSAIHTGVTALSGLVTDFGATPTAVSISASLATNASALLAAAKVTNPTSVAAATAIVANLNSLTSALTAASTPAPTPTPAAA